MKKLLGFSLLMMFMSFGMAKQLNTYKKATQNTVYVCGKSKIYHNSDSHSALDRCKSGIEEMTESKAKSLGKRVCKCRD